MTFNFGIISNDASVMKLNHGQPNRASGNKEESWYLIPA